MKQDYKTAVPKEELEKSAETRKALLTKWGFEPISMMWFSTIHDRNLDVLVEDTLAQGSYIASNYNVRDGALAQTPTRLVERLLKFYTEPGDIVLNPMAERIPHLLIANYLKLHAIGQDICQKFYEHDVEKLKKRILSAQFLDSDNNKIVREDESHFFTIYNGLTFNLTLGDSRHLDLPDNYVDHITLSPPYWDIGKYGDEPEQIGSGSESYEDFLNNLGEIFKECFRVLKKDKFMCVQVNDFRKNQKFYNFHGDTIKVLEDVGFTPWDLQVYNISVHPIGAIFTSQLSDRKIFAKNHEFNWSVKKT